MPILISHQEIQLKKNQEILQSICRNGLKSLRDISSDVTVNPVLQIQSVQGNICVNYLDLSNMNEEQKKSVIKDAVFEEYCGIYGITLERQWPFQFFKSKELRESEAAERLNHSIVFMLKPPRKLKAIYNFPHLSGPAELGFYDVDPHGNLDGVTQVGFNRNLLDLSQVIPRHLYEYKTTHAFNTEEFLGIFVPEGLYEMAVTAFETLSIPIIKVFQCTKTFKDIPQILDILHNNKLTTPMTLSVPDYVTALSEYVKQHKLNDFSLHSVRLHTSFDFITRKILSITQHENLLIKTQARMQHHYSDDSAWITVHKNVGLSKMELFNRLQANTYHPKEHLEMMKTAASESISLFNELSKAKGDEFSLVFLYQSVSRYQIIQLEKVGVEIVYQPFFKILSFPKNLKSKVDAIINSPEKHAVVTLQANIRGFFSRKHQENTEQLVANPEFSL